MNSPTRKIPDIETAIIAELSALIQKITGVQLGTGQSSMVESRLKKRVLDLGLSSLSDYYDHFKSNELNEIQNLISLLTTHHTFFFREIYAL